MLSDPLDDLVRITDTASNGERKRVAKGVLACWSLEVLVLPCASWLPQDTERDPLHQVHPAFLSKVASTKYLLYPEKRLSY